jgi:hypothetical protein
MYLLHQGHGSAHPEFLRSNTSSLLVGVVVGHRVVEAVPVDLEPGLVYL